MAIRRRDAEDSGETRLDDDSASLRLREVENGAVINRRGVLWRAGLAAAGGVAALTALDDESAQAITGTAFMLGTTNNAGNSTILQTTPGITQGFSTLLSLDGSDPHVTQSTLDVGGPSGGRAINAHVGSGVAVVGTGTGGATGVSGSSGSGTGVLGTSGSGHGVFANSPSGTALFVTGKVHFSRSGAGSVAKGSKTRTINIPGMAASSLVLATLQVAIGGLYITGVVPAAGKFTLHLNKAAPRSMKFAWFAVAG
jgi:hypothetical protein